MKVVLLLALAAFAAAEPLAALVDRHEVERSTKTPNGYYKGSKSLLGDTVDAKLDVWNSSTLNVVLSGAVELDCVETYSYSSLKIKVLGEGEKEDCVTEGLKKNKVDLDSIIFDTHSNEITITIKYHNIPVSITLKHSGSTKHATSKLTIDELFEQRYVLYSSSKPKGNYAGEVTLLGEDVTATIKIEDGGKLEFTVGGVITLDCPDEPYTYASGVISFTNIDKDGDCAHDAMEKNKVELSKVAYDSKKDTVTVTITYKKVPLSLELKHKGDVRMLGEVALLSEAR